MLLRLDRIRAHLKEYWSKVVATVDERGFRAPRFAAAGYTFPNEVKTHFHGLLYYDQ
jgi:hypothetical protein